MGCRLKRPCIPTPRTTATLYTSTLLPRSQLRQINLPHLLAINIVVNWALKYYTSPLPEIIWLGPHKMHVPFMPAGTSKKLRTALLSYRFMETGIWLFNGRLQLMQKAQSSRAGNKNFGISDPTWHSMHFLLPCCGSQDTLSYLLNWTEARCCHWQWNWRFHLCTPITTMAVYIHLWKTHHLCHGG